MARRRSPQRDKAFEIWKQSNGEKPLVEIAKELGVLDTQIRKWKNQDKWEQKIKGTLPKNKRNVTKTKKEQEKEKTIAEKVIEESDIENSDLTEKQRLFCLYYIKSFNATMSAIKAGYSKETAHVQGPRLLGNVRIREEIQKLKSQMYQGIFIDAMDVLKKYAEIAFADITEYVEFGSKEIPERDSEGRIRKDEDGEVITYPISFVGLKDSSEIDGTLITEVKQGREGISIKLADKMKALEKLEKYFDVIPDAWKRKVEEEKLKMQQEKLDIEKKKIGEDKDKPIEITIVRKGEGK